MPSIPSEKLDPRIKNIWRINDLIASLVSINLFLLITAGVLRLTASEGAVGFLNQIADALIPADVALSVAAVVLFAFVIPPVRYARWRYQISDDFLEIMTGIVWKKRTVIPFIRVQNTDTKQGPLMRLFGLSSVTVSTAAGEHEIPGLDVRVADELRNRAAELARVAREDV